MLALTLENGFFLRSPLDDPIFHVLLVWHQTFGKNELFVWIVSPMENNIVLEVVEEGVEGEVLCHHLVFKSLERRLLHTE